MSASTSANNAPPGDNPYLESKHTGLLMAAVMAMSVCQFIDMTVANVALPHMQTSLSASLDTISWALTSYIIAGVMVIPLTGLPVCLGAMWCRNIADPDRIVPRASGYWRVLSGYNGTNHHVRSQPAE
jgi:hypothetical protein